MSAGVMDRVACGDGAESVAVDVPDVVYLLAASHSGSTLLAMLLGAHGEAVTVGELAPSGIADLATYRCSCRALLGACPFWARVSAEMAGRGQSFALDRFGTRFRSSSSGYVRWLLRPLHRGRLLEAVRGFGLGLSPTWRADRVRIGEANKALVASVRRVAGRRVVVDSSKSAVRLKYLLRVPGLRVKVIRLIRDGRGVALTYMDPACFADADDPAFRGSRESERLGMAWAALEWRRSNEEAEHVVSGLGASDWMLVRYEDLCGDPDGTLGALFRFIGLDPAGGCRAFKARAHHVLGNGMRFDSASEIRLDERWKAVLGAEDLRVFDSVAGGLLERYGYGRGGAADG